MGVRSRHSEEARTVAHIAAGFLAVLLRFVSWWEAIALAGLAVAFNMYGLPRIARGQPQREPGRERGLHSSAVLYPLVILLLVFLLPERLDIVAGAWGVLAFGDGMATLVGLRFGGWRIPWNAEKSVAGTVAFVVAGGAAGAALCWWCRPAVVPPPYVWFSLGGSVLAAGVAALVETIPIKLNDNVSVTVTAAATLWWLSLVSEDMLAAAFPGLLSAAPLAVAANVIAAGAGYAARIVSPSGAAVGAVIGTIVLLCAGTGGWILLMTTLAVAAGASRAGLQRKRALGIAEPRGGRRGAANALANTGVAAGAAVLVVATYAKEPALIGFVAALCAAGSDTMASEIGKAREYRTYTLPMFQRVSPGAPGGVSVSGTIAGLLGALALAAAAAALGLVDKDTIPVIVLGAIAGGIVESVLGARLRDGNILDNHTLNAINTAVAAFLAVLLA